MIRFSIIICTYNPNQEIFQRLLNAIIQFDISSPEHEVIIVDNNSSLALKENDLVKSFLDKKNNSKPISEKNPGLTSARIAGIKEAKYDWLVFFDDDNEPATDYLLKAAEAIEKYPQVGAWGPGKIEVVYTDNSTQKWLFQYKYLFQERNCNESIFGFANGYQDYYPDGTGLCIRKIIALEYAKRVEGNVYSLSDRSGKSLSSGGDLQLILTATDYSYAVGREKNLRLKHNISRNKCRLSYILKLLYGVESCNYIAHAQVLKWDVNKKNEFHFMPNYLFLKIIYNTLFIQKAGVRRMMLKIAVITGQQQGIALLKCKGHPSMLINLFSFLINF